MVAKGVDKGFTIIEVTLFLAVTGLLFAMLLAGAGTAVRRERYNDSVSNLQEILQAQYSKVANTQSDSSRTTCTEGGTGTTNPYIRPGLTPADPGRTLNCDIYGRLIIFDNPSNNDTGNIYAYNVIGLDSKDAGIDIQGKTLVQALTALKLSRDTDSQEISNLTWSAHVQPPKSINNGKFAGDNDPNNPNAVLIVRSPLSDSIVTFIGAVTVSDPTSPNWWGLTSVLNATPPNMVTGRSMSLCVESSSRTFASMRAIYIAPFGSGPSAVSIAPLDVSDSTTDVPKVNCG